MEIEVKQMSRQEKRKLWESRLLDWEAGGLSQEKYCESEGLSLHTFRYWRQKFIKPDAEKISMVPVSIVPDALNSEENSISFPRASSHQESGLSISIGGRFQVEVMKQFDTETLGQLLKTLERL